MNITSIRIMPKEDAGPKVASVSIVIDNAIVFYGISIVKRKDSEELFVSMASHRNRDGQFKDIYYHPISSEARQDLSEKILNAYAKVKEDPSTTVFNMGIPEAKPVLDSIRFSEYTVGNKVRTSASAVVDGEMLIGLVRIMEDAESGDKWLAFPGRKMSDDTYKDIYHPVDAETRAIMTEAILGAYAVQGEEAVA